MNSENNIDPHYLEMLLLGDPIKQTEVLYNLAFEEVDNNTVETITKLIECEDKSVRNAASNFLIQNNNKSIPQNVINYVSSADISVRNLAGEILLKKSNDSLSVILSNIQNLSNDDDIKFLLDVIGLIGNSAAEELIIDILLKNENENVIVACIEALGNIKSEKAVNTIISFFDKAEVLKPVVVESIGKINTKDSLTFITKNFSCDDDLLKFTMIESLGEIGDESTFYFLLSQLDKLNGALIWPLLESIYKLKVKYNLDVPFDEKIKKCVLETIINSESHYQIIAAHLVSVFDDPEILYACLSIYGLDEELNEVLYEKFMENKKTILPKLHTVIDNSNKNLYLVLDLLNHICTSEPDILNNSSQLEKRKLTSSLSQCLINPDETVRIATAELLFKLDIDTALLFIDTMLSDENFWNRIRLIDLLGDSSNPIVMSALEKLVNDPEEMVSEKAKEMALRKQYFTN